MNFATKEKRQCSLDYTLPTVDVLEIALESGFAGSAKNTGTSPFQEMEGGNW